MNKSKIIDIPVKMEKYYGKGKMFHPSIEVIEDILKIIPHGKITTIDILCKKLASDFGTNVTCPMRTGNAIKKIIEKFSNDNSNVTIPFWRVIKKDKTIINSKHYEFCASKLEDEGFALSFIDSEKVKVLFDSKNVFSFL